MAYKDPQDPRKKAGAKAAYAKRRAKLHDVDDVDKARHRKYQLLKRYGLSTQGYMDLLAAQGGVCAICSLQETYMKHGKACPLSVDHDHSSGKVRGLLCNSCNRSIGLMRDDPVVVMRAALYLRRHRG